MKPAIDYYEIFDGLLKRGAQVDLIDRTSVMGSRDPRVRLALRTAEPSAPVALAAFLQRKSYDAVFAIGESVSILLALLLKGTRSCPGFVTIGHRLTAPKKQILLRLSRGYSRCSRNTPAGFGVSHEGALAGITAILEGMAMGKPVISTATVGMHPGIIRTERAGCWFLPTTTLTP